MIVIYSHSREVWHIPGKAMKEENEAEPPLSACGALAPVFTVTFTYPSDRFLAAMINVVSSQCKMIDVFKNQVITRNYELANRVLVVLGVSQPNDHREVTHRW